MTDKVFGELKKVGEECGWKWQGKCTVDFGGRAQEVDLLIQGEEQTRVLKRQRDAFTLFLEKWPDLQEEVICALIKYYNEEERFSYGPQDREESKKWWPEIETKEALLQAVTLESILVPDGYMLEEERRIYLLFSKKWGGEDTDDNGIGVCFTDEEIEEIGYKDMAF